jgi:hypothetical protein
MINLLPQSEKDRLEWEQNKKIIIINWSLVLSFFVFLIIGLSLVNAYIASQVGANTGALLDAEKNYQKTGLNDFQKEIVKFNLGLEKVDQFYGQKKYVSEILEKLTPLIKKGGVYVKNFSFSLTFKDRKPYYNISINGYAPTRELLFMFKKNLEKEKGFSDISLPQESWVKPVDISFVLNLAIK